MISELFDFFGSLHPLVVHLPIGFIILTLLVNIIIKKKNNSVRRLITLGWFFSFISGAIAALFGWFLGDNNYYFESQIDIHKWTGFAFVGLTFFIWILRTINFNAPSSVNRFFNFTILILILITGHYGGEMTHGKGYLINSLPFVKQNKAQTVLLTNKYDSLDSIYVYEDLIYPILKEKCIACHNKNNSYGGLDISTFENLVKGGNNSHGIQKGNPYKSSIFKRVSLSQNQPKFMPPSGIPMSFDQVAVLKWWIENGAKLRTPLTKLRNDNSIRTLVEVNYNLDLKEKSYIEKLRLDPVSENKLKILSKEKYRWRFLNSEKSLLEIKFIAKKITSDDINLLQTLKGNITWLNLSNCELKDEMLSTLSELPNLTRLRIQKNNLTDRGIPFLKNIKNLRELNIYGTQITDASFNIFSQMKNLEKIFLWNSKVSALGIEKFKTQNPTIEIISGL